MNFQSKFSPVIPWSGESCWGRAMSGGVMVLALLVCHATDAQAANSVDLTFKYTVVQGTCTLDVPASKPMGEVTGVASAIGKNWVYLNKSSLTVSLTECNGTASSSTRPAIKLVAPPVAASGSADRKTKIFTSATNKTGLGVVLSDNALTDGDAANLVTLSGADAFVNLGLQNTVAVNQSKVLNVALACGEASDCTGTSLVAGAGDVSIQFAFVYR